MKTQIADVVICGAGIAGVSAAYHLAVKNGIQKVLIVDERPPLTLTSDKSTECYRNWWPGPGDIMVRFMNRSIDLLEALNEESGHYFKMNRRGYVFMTSDPKHVPIMEKSAREISQLGAGPLRCHQGRSDDPFYPPPTVQDLDLQLTGADLVLDPAHIQKQYPFISNQAVAMLHIRRAGWLSAQQLGMYLLDQAKARGATFIKGRVTDVTAADGQIETVHVDTISGPLQISTRTLVIAAGPFLKQACAMLGLDLPVFNELHGKIAFKDSQGIISREAPLMIWNDPITLPWSTAERTELAGRNDTHWLLEAFPGGVHFRPEGGVDSPIILALWTYEEEAQEPVWPPVFKAEYAEIVLRGLTHMIPELSVYLNKIGRPVVDGGYYCKTRENRPLIGPLPVQGAYVIGALSGYGIMAAAAAGELLAQHVTGGDLPDYAPAFRLERYEDPEYRKMLASWDAKTGQL